jgi:histidyl-tRNA synthetase
MLGSQRSVNEAILLQTTRAILEHAGHKEILVRLNSVGTKENVAEFERRMAAFVRKRIAEFPAELRQCVKKDIFYLAKSKEDKYKEWADSAPQSVDYLSEQSRIHFKEILEFLEAVELPFVIDPSLIGDLQYTTEAIFEITTQSAGSEFTLARIMRWDRLSKRANLKREMPAVSATIAAKTNKNQRILPVKQAKPKFYLIQFGPEAKYKSFIVLERLRRAGIPVIHSLVKDKLLSQISLVEQGNTPYIILIGQKEAIDNVAVVRSTETRVQFTVPITELGEFIKKSPDFK